MHYEYGLKEVSVIHERGRGIAWRIWPSAHVLIDWLETNKDSWCSKPIHCIEIGAGVGMVGIVAAGLGANKVTLTDLPEVLPALERSVASNHEELQNHLIVAPLSYSDDQDIENSLVSIASSSKLVVLASDVIYWESLFVPIAETLQKLFARKPDGVAYIGYGKRDWKSEKRFFTKILKQHDLACETVGQWMANEDNCDAQDTDGAVIYNEAIGTDDNDWNTRIYKITRVAAAEPSADAPEYKQYTQKKGCTKIGNNEVNRKTNSRPDKKSGRG